MSSELPLIDPPSAETVRLSVARTVPLRRISPEVFPAESVISPLAAVPPASIREAVVVSRSPVPSSPAEILTSLFAAMWLLIVMSSAAEMVMLSGSTGALTTMSAPGCEDNVSLGQDLPADTQPAAGVQHQVACGQ